MRQPFGQRVREIRGLIDEVVDARWSHPAWWALVAGVAWLEGQAKAGGPGADEGLFLRATGWPHADIAAPRLARTRTRRPRPPRPPPHAVAGSTLPPGLKRTLLRARRRPSAGLPTVAALGGRGRLSSLRFADGDRPPAPLFAASMPALGAYPHDPRGSFTLTLIQHEGGWSASVLGTGRAGGAGAAGCLDAWLEELDRVRAEGRGV